MTAPHYEHSATFNLALLPDTVTETPADTMVLVASVTVDYDVPVVDDGGPVAYPMQFGRRLPPAAQDSPVWKALCDAVDKVWASRIIDPAHRLMTVRNPCQWHPLALRAKAGLALMDESDTAYGGKQWCSADWPGLMASQMGVAFQGLLELPIAQQITFVRHVSSFLPYAGTPQWVDFLGYALGADISCTLLWRNTGTGALRPEGHSDITSAIYDSGPWYPTSRLDVTVRVGADYPLADDHFQALFALMAPYDYVIRNLTLEVQDG